MQLTSGHYIFMNEQNELELKKMYWHSRRGMLELDLILVPFAEKKLPALAEGQQKEYARLLQEEDQDLYQWLVKGVASAEPALQPIIDIIRQSGSA